MKLWYLLNEHYVHKEVYDVIPHSMQQCWSRSAVGVSHPPLVERSALALKVANKWDARLYNLLGVDNDSLPLLLAVYVSSHSAAILPGDCSVVAKWLRLHWRSRFRAIPRTDTVGQIRRVSMNVSETPVSEGYPDSQDHNAITSK